MAKYGYARVSTRSQEVSTQVEALKRLGVDENYIEAEVVSGTKVQRQGLERIKAELEVGDELHITKLDRLGRNMRELHKIAAFLEDKGVVLVINGQAHDPSTPTGRLLFNVLAMVSEFERDMIAERTAERLAHIKATGGQVGRKKSTNTEQEAMIRKLLDAGYSYSQIRKATRLSNGTIYRIAKSGEDDAATKADLSIAKQARKLLSEQERDLQKLAKLFGAGE